MQEIKMEDASDCPGARPCPWEYAILTEEVAAGRFFCESYGIRIRSLTTGEESRVEHITVSASRIWELYDLLVRNAVSPVHLRDVVEDWL